MPFDYETLLSGSYWSGIEVTAKPTIVTYSFPTTNAPPGYIATLDDPNLTTQAIASYQGFDAAEQDLARQALAEWGGACGLVFIEVAPGQGDINFQKLDFTGTGYEGAGGIGYHPFGDWQFAGYPYFTSDLDSSGDVFINSALPISYGNLLHEIGHAIGLKHPTETLTDYAASPAVVHSVSATDDPRWTIMSQLPGGTGHLTKFDMLAVREIYGRDSRDPDYTWDALTQTLTQHGRGGDEAIRGSSVIDVITGGAGNDKLFGLNGDDTLNGGAGNDLIDGGPGTDRMIGGDGDDRYFVDSSDDTIVERADGGDDSVIATASYRLSANVEELQFWGDAALTGTGNAVGNTIFGNNGGDTLLGLGGADYIVGGTGADVLLGGTENDSLFGGDGKDRITGGAGGDYMIGDAGADRFVFTALADFETGLSLDLIGDFSRAEHDRIDLHTIDPDSVTPGDQAFTFIGTAAFTTNGQFQVRYEVSGSDLLVQIDTNHDTVADYAFLVAGTPDLVATDFVL